MGWWWSSSPQKSSSQSATHPSSEACPSTSTSPSNTTAPTPWTPPQSQTPQQQLQPQNPKFARDQLADAELEQFLASLHEAAGASTTTTATPPPPPAGLHPTSPFTESPPSTTTITTTTPPSIAPESLYPETMSCRSAFDYAFFCQSFGGQFVNVYRYGELRSCSEHWDNFWLCMRARASPEAESKRMIRDHYRKKAVKYKMGPSSEDVWDMRTKPVRDAFGGDYAALEAEMRASEQEAAAAAAAGVAAGSS